MKKLIKLLPLLLLLTSCGEKWQKGSIYIFGSSTYNSVEYMILPNNHIRIKNYGTIIDFYNVGLYYTY